MTSPKPPQYDSIGSQYVDIKSLPVVKYTEKAGLQNKVTSLMPKSNDVRVLDLACGTGHYAHLLLSWGATEVVGIDISSAMVETARAQSQSTQLPPGKHLRFEVGDVVDLGTVGVRGEAFTMVTGVWLLNYASCKAEMVKMFRGISANLEPGGVFVGIVAEPIEDMDDFARRREPIFQQNRGLYGLEFDYREPLASGEGFKTAATIHVERPFQFESYHLKQSVYETAAREGGMSGQVEWGILQPSEEGIALMGEEFWAAYSEWSPKAATLVVRK
jgi:SAM-dependent methyltransferase